MLGGGAGGGGRAGVIEGGGVGKKIQEGMIGWVGVKNTFLGFFSSEKIMTFYTFCPLFSQFLAIFASKVALFD